MYTVVLNWLTVMFFLLKAVIPTTTLQVKTFYVGENGTLSCNFINSTKSVVWLKNNRTLSNNYNQTYDGRLIKFWRFEKSFIGIYSCHEIVKGFPGKLLVAYNVSLATNLEFSFVAMERMKLDANSLIAAGSTHTFQCLAVGEGAITYEWFKNGKKRRTYNEPKFMLHSVNSDDDGRYRCEVKNKGKVLKFSFTLTVQEKVSRTHTKVKPSIDKGSFKNQTRYVGDNTTIECRALITGSIIGYAMFKWKGPFNQTVLQKFVDSFDIDENFLKGVKFSWIYNYNQFPRIDGVEAVLLNLSLNDAGYYTCLAINNIVNDLTTMYLNVLPRIVYKNPPQPTKKSKKMTLIVASLGVLMAIGLIIIPTVFYTILKLKKKTDRDALAMEMLNGNAGED